MRAVYTGHEPLTFPGYLDLDTGRTLHAEPGGTYEVAPAGGTNAPDIPPQWFTEVKRLPPPPARKPETDSDDDEDNSPEVHPPVLGDEDE